MGLILYYFCIIKYIQLLTVLGQAWRWWIHTYVRTCTLLASYDSDIWTRWFSVNQNNSKHIHTVNINDSAVTNIISSSDLWQPVPLQHMVEPRPILHLTGEEKGTKGVEVASKSELWLALRMVVKADCRVFGIASDVYNLGLTIVIHICSAYMIRVYIYTYVYVYKYVWIEVKSKIIFIESVKSTAFHLNCNYQYPEDDRPSHESWSIVALKLSWFYLMSMWVLPVSWAYRYIQPRAMELIRYRTLQEHLCAEADGLSVESMLSLNYKVKFVSSEYIYIIYINKYEATQTIIKSILCTNNYNFNLYTTSQL